MIYALDKLADYIKKPYKRVLGSFQQYDDGGTPVVRYSIYSNDSEYTLDIISVSEGVVTFDLSSYAGDPNYVGLFLAPAAHPNCFFSQDNSISPNIIVISMNLGNNPDSRGFGASNGQQIHFELRFYPEL